MSGATSSWIEPFLEALGAERGAAANTLAAYRRDLEHFTGWLRGAGADPESAGRAEIEGYLAVLEGAGLSPATRARRLSAIRQFSRFALSEGWRADDPAARIGGPTTRRPGSAGRARRASGPAPCRWPRSAGCSTRRLPEPVTRRGPGRAGSG